MDQSGTGAGVLSGEAVTLAAPEGGRSSLTEDTGVDGAVETVDDSSTSVVRSFAVLEDEIFTSPPTL